MITNKRTWSFFQDAHMMVIGGIGFLISYMKRYRYSGLGFNFLLAAISYQWSVLFQDKDELSELTMSHNLCKIRN